MPDILIVDDTPANLSVLHGMLTGHDYKVRPAINGDLALKAVQTELPDLILLDIRMPGKDGYEVCRELKASPRTRHVPVIFISALDDIQDKVKAFEVGGVDYITKPFHLEEVLARVQLHLMLQQQRRAIEELNTFKDELLRIVAHDLKNPISVISGYTDMLMEDIEDPELRDFVGRIQRSATQMLNLVTDLLDVARSEGNIPLNLQAVAVAGLLQSCVENYRLPAQQKQLVYHYVPPEAGLHLHIDPDRFAQVVNNLISNAVKYTDAGGTVRIESQVSADSFRLHIHDTGHGIAAEDLPHLFDKFYRVKNTQNRKIEGTGLGLAIARAIIEKHQGRIDVHSEIGQGSVFTIVLPLTAAA
ncbi:MAG: hybrid sensor histidine kinase/response regulator [Anaerolineae bacterium]|nr:hybrid sensor histidine kinase/response regulator [Anaerolineae bacterium]